MAGYLSRTGLRYWAPDPAGNHTEQVNDPNVLVSLPLPNDSDRVSSQTTGDIDLFDYATVLDILAPTHSIPVVALQTSAAMEATGNRNVASVLRNGGDSFGATVNVNSTTYSTAIDLFETNLPLATAWTPTNLDATELGFTNQV